MPPQQPPAKKAKVVKQQHTLAQKVWFLGAHDQHPEWKAARLAAEYKAEFDVQLSKSTVSDWLKPAAIRSVRELSQVHTKTGQTQPVKATRARDPKCKKLEATLRL